MWTAQKTHHEQVNNIRQVMMLSVHGVLRWCVYFLPVPIRWTFT